MSRWVKILLWLYAAGVLITLPIQIDLRITNCVDVESCHFDVLKTAGFALTWPLSWGVVAAGISFRAILIFILLSTLWFTTAYGLHRVFSATDIRSRLKVLISLYAVGFLITLPYQVGLRILGCSHREACHIGLIKDAIWALLWPLKWSAAILEFLPQIMIPVVMLICAAVFLLVSHRVSPTADTKGRAKILLLLYISGFLITLPYQIGTGLLSCAEPGPCYIGVIRIAVWASLIWPATWGAGLAEALYQKVLPVIALICVVLFLLVEGFHRIRTVEAGGNTADLAPAERLVLSRYELQNATVALFALLAAVWALTSVSSGLSYGNGDGKLFQATVLTALKFARMFEITNINPIQGVGSQLLPLNPWVNPAYWPFAILNTQHATDVSGVIALACFAISCYLMARCFELPVLPSIISAQLTFVLFAPAVVVLGFASVFYINPGWAVVCAPHMLALGVLARVEAIRFMNFAAATGSIFLLFLFSIYCDPLWTLISGFSWAVPFAIVTFAPMAARPVLTRCAVLACCVILLLLSGVLEYEYTLSKYMARVQLSELLSRPPSLPFASFLFSQAVAVFYYFICILGWFSGLSVLRRGRIRILVVAGVASFLFLVGYTAGFLSLLSNWWLPLPIYVEHSLFPLFTTSAIAGVWAGLRVIVPFVPPASSVWRKRKSTAQESLAAAIALFQRQPEAIPPRWCARRSRIPAVLLGLVFLPGLALLLTDRAHSLAEIFRQPWPEEPELEKFFADKVGADVGRPFHGSVTFWYPGLDDYLSINSLWMASIPTANEYSQLVTLQSTYLNAALLKKDVSKDLNRFDPWISSNGSYEVLFRFLQALGVRYIVGHNRFPEADERHFISSNVPRRPTFSAHGSWQIYELPDPNLGNYSPTELVKKQTAADIIATLGATGFDFHRQVVLSSNFTTSLVPARAMQLTVIRGGLHVSGQSDGTSLVLLPQQFSHCLRAHDARVRLSRADLMMTAIMFSGNVDTDITFSYGIFSPGCRRADLEDMKTLGLVEAFLKQVESTKLSR
jgi:hypothetical protein